MGNKGKAERKRLEALQRVAKNREKYDKMIQQGKTEQGFCLENFLRAYDIPSENCDFYEGTVLKSKSGIFSDESQLFQYRNNMRDGDEIYLYDLGEMLAEYGHPQAYVVTIAADDGSGYIDDFERAELYFDKESALKAYDSLRQSEELLNIADEIALAESLLGEGFSVSLHRDCFQNALYDVFCESGDILIYEKIPKITEDIRDECIAAKKLLSDNAFAIKIISVEKKHTHWEEICEWGNQSRYAVGFLDKETTPEYNEVEIGISSKFQGRPCNVIDFLLSSKMFAQKVALCRREEY